MALTNKQMGDVVNKVGSMSDEQINELVREVKAVRNYRASNATRGLRVGDRVTFNAGRKGGVRSGYVEKVNRKNVKVQDADSRTLWNVSATLLERAD